MSKETMKKPVGVKPYTVSNIEKGLQLVRKGASILTASKQYNVPYTTLYDRVKGKYLLDAKPGPTSILSREEEKEIVSWIFDLSECGYPITKEHLLDSVQNIELKPNRKTPFMNGRPSKHWYKAFLKWNLELSEKLCQNLATFEIIFYWYMNKKA